MVGHSKDACESVIQKLVTSVDTTNRLPGKAALSFPCLAAGGTFSALAAGLGGWGGTAALSMARESHSINGVSEPVLYLQSNITKV